MICGFRGNESVWLFEDLFATKNDVDFARFIWTYHGLSVITRFLAKNDFLGHGRIVVIPTAVDATCRGIGHGRQIGRSAATHERHVDAIGIDGPIGRHGNGQFAIEFGIGVDRLSDSIEKRSPSGTAIADFRPYAFGFVDERRVGRARRGRL